MAEFEVGQEVVLRGTVIQIDGSKCLVRTPYERSHIWIAAESLAHGTIPAPVTVKCSLGIEHALTDLKTLQARAEALGMNMTFADWAALRDFSKICAKLKEKGVTAEQLVEGL